MLVLPAKGQKRQSTTVSEPIRTTIHKVHGDNVIDGISTRISEMIDSLPRDRKEKVLAIRQKIDADKYSIKERLNVATDRLIEDIITKRMGENETQGTTRRR